MTLSETSSDSSESATSDEGSRSSPTSDRGSTAVSDAEGAEQESNSEEKVDPKCLAWFKEAIAKIKGQKQRPGLERIIQALKQFQPASSDKDHDQYIKRQLSYAIRDGHLFKVWSKNMPSYKDTENLKSLRKNSTVKSDGDVRRAVKTAVREIGEVNGTVEKDIVNYISYTFTVHVDQETLGLMVKKALGFLSGKAELTLNKDDNSKFISKHHCSDKKSKLEKDDDEGTSRPNTAMSSASFPRDSAESKPKKVKKKQKPATKQETPMSSVADSSKPSTSSSAGAKASPSKLKYEVEPSLEIMEKRLSAASNSESPKKDEKKKKKRQLEKSLELSGEIFSASSTSSPAKPGKVASTSESPAKTPSKSKADSPAKSASKLAEAMSKSSSKTPQSSKPSKMATPESSGKAEKKVDETSSRVKSPRPSTSSTPAAINTGKDDSTKVVDAPEKKKRGRPPLKKNDHSVSERKPKSPPSSRHRSTDSDRVSELPFFDAAEFAAHVPKELKDQLSTYFTPTSARRSRNSQLSMAVAISHQKATTSKKSASDSVDSDREKSKTKDKEKSKPLPVHRKSESSGPPLIDVKSEDTEDTGTDDRDGTPDNDSETGQRRRKQGSQQLKGLQDGLSGYFKAPEGERKRKPPSNFTPVSNRYRQSEKKTTEPTSAKGSSGEEQSLSQSEDGDGEQEEEEDGNNDESEEDSDDVEDEDANQDEESESRSPSTAASGSGKHVFRMPDKIPKSLENLFRKARQRALEKIPIVDPEYDGPLPPKIQLGDKKIVTWYTSPFPEEYIRCECLHICEFCLQYMKTVRVLKSHYEKCPWHRPPGTEIYHDTVDIEGNERQELIIYETDGNDWKEYCQNLCLLAKLYLDHKTLYYDVEPFLFYVLTRRDKFGDHLIGYFSKEKNSPQRYNVSCIMVLPPYQGGGYGRFLIDFSYLLSRVEGQHGTPEKPLSELGQLSYQAYWKSAILDFFLDQRQKSATKTSIKAMCDATGMWPQDVADTLQQLGFIVKNDETKAWEFALLQDVVSVYMEKKNTAKKRLPVVADKLRWYPWKGESTGLTTTESERSGSRAEQLETGDELQRDGHPSGDTSESELDQPMDIQQPATPEPTSPPPTGRPSSQRSRGETPKGRPSSRKSSSRDRSASQQSPPTPVQLPIVKRRGRPPKLDRRRKDHGRDSEITSGGRKKRKGKFRSTRSPSKATSSQPKNYKGRGEEFRAGAEKRRKHKRIDQSADESDISSFLNSPHRRSQSMSSESSADESLASPSSSHPKHGRPYISKEKDNDNESTSSDSHVSLSHLDQPPRAPHPPQPVDMMDQGVCTDSPVDHHTQQADTQSTGLPLSSNQVHQAVHPSSAEICVQTEPLDAMDQQLQDSKPQSVGLSRQDSYASHHMTDSVQTEMMPSVGLHMATSAEHLMPSAQTFQQQNQAAQVMPSPSFHSTQPSTPYPLSPQMSHVGSVGQPDSVISAHELQMSQESEMIIQNAPSYVDTNAYEHHYPSQTASTISATSPPGYHQYQQASPAGSQASMHNVSAVPQPYADIIRAPQTPTTPLPAGSYNVAPSPRSMTAGPFGEHPDSPLSARSVMRTPMPGTYPDLYTRAASVAPYVDPTLIRNSRSVQPQRYNDCELAQQQQQQLQQQIMPPTPHTSHSHTSSSSKQRHRPREQPVAPTYPQMASHSHSQQQLFFHPAYPPSVMASMGFNPMQDQHPGYAAMQQASDPALSKLEQLTRGIPSQQAMQQSAMAAQYGAHHSAGRSQSQARQLQMQQHVASGMGMPSGAGMPVQYYSNIMGKQTFPGQSPVMNAAYGPQAFFGQGVPMPSQVPGYSRGPVGAPGQAQAMYPGYPAPFYPTGTPQHPHTGHHTSMRQ